MPVPPFSGKYVSPGRHNCTEAEVEAAFVSDPQFAASKTRAKIWADWVTAVALLRGAITVHGAWISGSFASNKVDPKDMDVTFIVSAEDRAKRAKADLQIVDSFQIRKAHPLTGELGPAHGLLVDSYILDWAPHDLTPSGQMGPAYEQYAVLRGYWDDWWSRGRVTPKPKPTKRVDALPTRGYLEVSFDAYA